jgi:hypothetical protein
MKPIKGGIPANESIIIEKQKEAHLFKKKKLIKEFNLLKQKPLLE